MKVSIYTKLSINIVAIFGTVILMSFVPDQFRDFFGDWQCAGATYVYSTDIMGGHYTGCDDGQGQHLPMIHWGYRHWLWLFMGIILFIVQAVRMIVLISKNDKV